jgi:hypothetical protein
MFGLASGSWANAGAEIDATSRANKQIKRASGIDMRGT